MAERVEFLKDSLTPNLKRFPTQLRNGVGQVLRYHEPRARAYARTNAPWKDQTGNARSGLDAKTGEETPDRQYLAIFHRVPYGIWLEVRFQGRNAVIMPTVRAFGPEVMTSLAGLMRRLEHIK